MGFNPYEMKWGGTVLYKKNNICQEERVARKQVELRVQPTQG